MKASSKYNHRFWPEVILVACLLAPFGITLFLPKHDSKPTVYHHSDGTFSLNLKGPQAELTGTINYSCTFSAASYLPHHFHPKVWLPKSFVALARGSMGTILDYSINQKRTANQSEWHV